jgi:hypothetical protein
MDDTIFSLFQNDILYLRIHHEANVCTSITDIFLTQNIPADATITSVRLYNPSITRIRRHKGGYLHPIIYRAFHFTVLASGLLMAHFWSGN